MREKILLIVGASGSGKTSVVEKLEEQYGLKSVCSYTTREKRNEDEYGHIFVTDEEFNRLSLVGFSEYGGNRYGATAEQIEESDLWVVDMPGVEYFKSAYTGGKKPIVIHLVTSMDEHEDFNERYERMLERGDGAEKAGFRTALDKIEFGGIDDISDYKVVNERGKLEETCKKIMDIFTGE